MKVQHEQTYCSIIKKILHNKQTFRKNNKLLFNTT